MKHDYPDIMDLANRLATVPVPHHDRGPKTSPQWWDENGVPRFVTHHPKFCPNIYANEVVLLEIACQSCERRFDVQMCRSSMDEVRARMMGIRGCSLEQQVRDNTIHYGDPPRHDDPNDGGCVSGNSMNVHDLRVKEFWKRVDEWQRVPELEIDLDDLDELRDAEPIADVLSESFRTPAGAPLTDEQKARWLAELNKDDK